MQRNKRVGSIVLASPCLALSCSRTAACSIVLLVSFLHSYKIHLCLGNETGAQADAGKVEERGSSALIYSNNRRPPLNWL